MTQPVYEREALLARLAGRRVVASVSGGKDSAAMSLYLAELGIEHDRVFLDTGWEHAKTYEYLSGELPRVIGPITVVASERDMVATIRKKGMFPSRQRRFCTQELKVFPMQKHIAALVDGGDDVVNAVGIRAGESMARSKLPEWEWSDGFDCETWRPLLGWSEEDVIAIHKRHGLAPNPLYLDGASRVGCWPCIYARKSEIRLVADTDPARIQLIEALEEEIADQARARYEAQGESFESLGYVAPVWFQNPLPDKRRCEACEGEPVAGPARDGEVLVCHLCDGRGTRRTGTPWPIRRVVDWARTARGGRQLELFAAPPSDQGCMRWGLCETEGSEAEVRP